MSTSYTIGAQSDWTLSDLDAIASILSDYNDSTWKLDIYENQFEIITANQMLDCYSSVGLPMMYNHWSFGKSFIHNQYDYRKGYTGLAYELVINSDPCVNYLMENNSKMMQCLVMAHAGYGHNSFFKNNYLFKKWTDAGNILSYVRFARDFIKDCESKHGYAAVESILDAAHSLMNVGIDTYPRVRSSKRHEEERNIELAKHREASYHEIWDTIPSSSADKESSDGKSHSQKRFKLPEENLLYFLEKHSLRLFTWQREILRIVRILAQYFYPQGLTKVINEGWATYTHYRTMTDLNESGILTDGAFMEFIHSHTSVIHQRSFESRGYGGINPYSIGFRMMRDIERILTEPDDEDMEFFPHWAGQGGVSEFMKDVVANYRDDSFIAQFLGPKTIRWFKYFTIDDDANKDVYSVIDIHDQDGYRRIRSDLAKSYEHRSPTIEVCEADVTGNRKICLIHNAIDGIRLMEDDAREVLRNVANLWGYTAVLNDHGHEFSTDPSPRSGIRYVDSTA